MTPKKTHWLRNSIVIMLVFAVAGLALAAAQFMNNSTPTAATATLEFTFEGAADGIAPNGAMFNVSNISSEEVLSEALAACGLADTYTVEQLQECLVTRGVYPANMVSRVRSYISLLDTSSSHEVSDTDYHATTYTVELYNDFDNSISQEQLEALLKAIVSAYKDNFARVYANGLEKTDLSASLADYDYLQQAEIIEDYFQAMTDYAQEMYDRRPAFLHEGAGFNDIVVRLNSLVGSDLARVKAEVTMNALSTDPERLGNHYGFEINALENQQANQQAYLARLDKLIDAYEKNSIVYLSNGQSVTKIDNNTNITYDTLISRQTEVSRRIAAAGAEAVTYEQLLADLAGDEPEAANETEETEGSTASDSPDAEALVRVQADAVEKSLLALVDKGNACVDDFEAMLKAFNAAEINDRTVAVTKYNYKAPKILSGAFVSSAIKTAGPLCAIGFMLCMVLIIRSRKKEARQAARRQAEFDGRRNRPHPGSG